MFITATYDGEQWTDYLIAFENCGIDSRKFLGFDEQYDI